MAAGGPIVAVLWRFSVEWADLWSVRGPLGEAATATGGLLLLGGGVGAIFVFVVLPVLLFWALVRGIATVFADSYARRLDRDRRAR